MWNHGEVIVRREVLGYSPVGPPPAPRPWHGRCWFALPVYVVEDTPEALVTYIASGAEFGYPEGPWPTPGSVHAWHPRPAWEGEGCLMVQKPGEHHAIWHFWNGPDRGFTHWYLNLQTAFARTAIGYDTQDLEVDMVVQPDGSWALKDWELLEERLAEGRFWPELDQWLRAYTTSLTERLDRGDRWWDPSYAEWTPPPEWQSPTLPDGWQAVPVTSAAPGAS